MFECPREVLDRAVDIRRLARVGQIAVPLQVLLARNGVARVVIDQGAAFGVGELQRERARRPFHQAILDRERIARRGRHRIALQLSQRGRIDEVVIDTDLVALPQQRALQHERRAKLTPRLHRRRDAVLACVTRRRRLQRVRERQGSQLPGDRFVQSVAKGLIAFQASDHGARQQHQASRLGATDEITAPSARRPRSRMR